MTITRLPIRVTRPASAPPRPTPADARTSSPTPAGQRTDYSNLLFERGRTILGVEEIAAKLKCTRHHVIGLIESGELGGIDIRNRGKRSTYRVPATEWERFLRSRVTV